jgi:NAD(P)-dependent dehydrogenase (short-subunit alcohol dehydrogenase family)
VTSCTALALVFARAGVPRLLCVADPADGLAGIVIGKDVCSISLAEVRRTLDVNVVAHFVMVKRLLPGMMKRNRGVIVTVSSVMGLLGAVLCLCERVKCVKCVKCVSV